jgi:hypothetical protein
LAYHLVLFRDYFNSVKPQGISCHESSQDNPVDLVAHKKKVCEWFMNPTKYQQEIDAEQRKHSGKCIVHLTKSHPTCDCHVKKECDKFLSNRKPNGSQNSSTTVGQLCHIMEDVYEDAVADDTVPVSLEDNNTNEESLIYFSPLPNHYLCLVKTCPSRVSRHEMKHPIIADSGANYQMFRDKEFSQHITPACGKVILGDGKTTLDIKGVGTVIFVVLVTTLLLSLM